MTWELSIRNRHRSQQFNTRLMRQITLRLLQEGLSLEAAELGIAFVAATEMARVNWQFLQHEGSTDVITFDHSETQESRRRLSWRRKQICGELYICLDDAKAQAKEFRTDWRHEAVRYVVHGILHLCGQDDHDPARRREMKREENRLVAWLAGKFDFRKLGA